MAISQTLIEQTPRMTQEIVTLFPAQGQWSEEDYFALPDSNHLVELSEGVIIMPPPPDTSHQSSAAKLFFALERFNREKKLGAVFFAPLAIRLWHGKIREPDLMFFLNEHKDRIGERASGPPDLAVEILSPATAKTDRNEKFSEYANAGVTEYWIVDPKAKTVEIYMLQEGAYILFGKFGKEETAKSKLLEGFEMQVAKMF